MRVEYRTNVQRTLEHTGTKIVNAYLGGFNKVTHTYTAQYTITASGKLMQKIFLCLQESNGCFGPRVLQEVDAMCSKFKNVNVTCSRSGKLTSEIFNIYLEDVLHPYVGDRNFLLVLDS